MKRMMIVMLSVAGLSMLADPAPGVKIALELQPGPNNPRNSEGVFMPLDDGTCSNVLMATESDLNSKLLQTLILSESVPDANIQGFNEATPLSEAFTVPYDGISDATINITFMPEDKRKLDSVALVSPDGVEYRLYDGHGKDPRRKYRRMRQQKP